jgi:hypothetical protein
MNNSIPSSGETYCGSPRWQGGLAQTAGVPLLINLLVIYRLFALSQVPLLAWTMSLRGRDTKNLARNTRKSQKAKVYFVVYSIIVNYFLP